MDMIKGNALHQIGELTPGACILFGITSWLVLDIDS